MTWQDTYQLWKNNQNLDPKIAAELRDLETDQDALEAAFAQPMSFGTAGMRGLIGPGIGRMNLYTVGAATEGLASFMDTWMRRLSGAELPLVLILVTNHASLPTMQLKCWVPTTFQALYSMIFGQHRSFRLRYAI